MDTDVSHDAGIERSKPSGMVRFGRALASVFNPAYVWNGINGIRKEKQEEHTKPHPASSDERKIKAETEYEELKKTGFLGTQKVSKLRYSFDVSSIKREKASDLSGSIPQRGSEADLEEHRSRSMARAKRNGMIFNADGTPMTSPKIATFESTTCSLRSDQTSDTKTSLNLRRPSLPSLKKVKSHFQLPTSKRSSVTPVPMSPTESDTWKTESDVNVIKKQQSRKDLHKQQKLSKRVSNLESKLEVARRELLQAMQSSSSVPDLSPRKSSRSFVPGGLSSLPSERTLYMKDSERAQKGDAGFRGPAPTFASRPATPNYLPHIPLEPFVVEQRMNDLNKKENFRQSRISGSNIVEDDDTLVVEAPSIQSQLDGAPSVECISSASKPDMEDMLEPSLEELSEHPTDPKHQEAMQMKSDIFSGPLSSSEARSVPDSHMKAEAPDPFRDTNLTFLPADQMIAASSSVDETKTGPGQISSANGHENAKPKPQATAKKSKTKKRKSDSTYKPQDDESDEDEWDRAPKSGARKSSGASLGSRKAEGRANERLANGKKSSKIRKGDSPNSANKRKIQKANSLLSKKPRTSPKVKKEAPDTPTGIKKGVIERGDTVQDPLVLDDSTEELPSQRKTKGTSSDNLPTKDTESRKADDSDIEHDIPKPSSGSGTALEPFDPDKVDKEKLISMRSNPNSTAAFGWVSEDIANLKKEHPNMTAGQLTKYISTLFNNENHKPSGTTPRTIRKTQSIAHHRPIVKRASLSPIKQPYQSVTHDIVPFGSPGKWSPEKTGFDMSPAGPGSNLQKPLFGKSQPLHRHSYFPKVETVVHTSSLADLVHDPDAVTVSPSKSRNVPPVPSISKGFEGHAAKVFTPAAAAADMAKEEGEFQWDDDVF